MRAYACTKIHAPNYKCTRTHSFNLEMSIPQFIIYTKGMSVYKHAQLQVTKCKLYVPAYILRRCMSVHMCMRMQACVLICRHL